MSLGKGGIHANPASSNPTLPAAANCHHHTERDSVENLITSLTYTLAYIQQNWWAKRVGGAGREKHNSCKWSTMISREQRIGSECHETWCSSLRPPCRPYTPRGKLPTTLTWDLFLPLLHLPTVEIWHLWLPCATYFKVKSTLPALLLMCNPVTVP